MDRTDELVKKEIVDELYWDYRVDAAKVNVQVQEGKVNLTGSVPSFSAKNAASNATWSVKGVKSVNNQLDIMLPSGIQIPTDEEIKSNAEWTLNWNPDVYSLDIQVIVTNGVVKLEGTVDSYWKLWKAEQLVSDLRGVIDVANHLTVTPGDDVEDKEIAQSIEKALERTFYVEAENITVLVEKGKVTLTGIVPSYYARGRAYEAAALTEGVVKVDNNIIVM